MRALVFFALESEARPFRAQTAVPPDVRIIVTGMGESKAASAARTWIHPGAADLVLTCGFAGALNPELHCGQVVYQADPGFPLTKGLSTTEGIPGRFLLTPKVIATAAEKAALWNATRADAVDMESELIRTAARQHHLPSATVRVISDTAQQDLPLDFSRFMRADGRMRYPQLALALARSPRKIAELWRFHQQLRRCSLRLANFLKAVV